jgi:hypothetical protein
MLYRIFSTAALLLFMLVWGSHLYAAGVEIEPLQYRLSGTLEDGGRFDGTFAIETSAFDMWPEDSIGRFDLVNVDIRLYNTTIFAGPDAPPLDGRATEGKLAQSGAAGGLQRLSFGAESDSGISGAFSEYRFAPFSGNPNAAMALEGDFQFGYWDGNGQPTVTSLSIERVPEPAAAAIAMMLVATSRRFLRR